VSNPREASRRDATPPHNSGGATTEIDRTIPDRHHTTNRTSPDKQKRPQHDVPAINIEISSGTAPLDSYTASHNPPPYQQQSFPRLSSTTTLTSSNSTLSSSNMTHHSDNKSQPRGSVMRPLTPETLLEKPSGCASRYIAFQLDKEATTKKLRELGDDALIPTVNIMSNDTYVGYMSKVCRDVFTLTCDPLTIKLASGTWMTTQKSIGFFFFVMTFPMH
jgi:hypothetical protein